MSVVDIRAAAPPNGTAGMPAMAPIAATSEVRRSPIRTHPLELRQRAKADYEGTAKSIAKIAAELGVGRTTINTWARQDDWERFAGAPPTRAAGYDRRSRRGRLTGRLFRVYGRQLGILEKRAGKDTDEKDARTLAVLAKTLETLIALDRDDGAKATKPESVDRADYRAELARTLSRWAEEGRGSGGTESPSV
jgi:transposase-like protein